MRTQSHLLVASLTLSSLLILSGCPCKPDGFQFVGAEGGLGTDLESLNDPAGMTGRWTTQAGDFTLFIADRGNNRIQRWDSQKSSIVSDSGSLPGQLLSPVSVAVTQFDVLNGKGLKNGELPPVAELSIYVTDAGNDRIQQFDLAGRFIRTWGRLGSSTGEFDSPRGIDIDYSGNVYVADSKNNRVQVFDSTGIFLTSWGGLGTSNGKFNTPVDISLAFSLADEVVYVAVSDSGNNRVQFFSTEGSYISSVEALSGVTGLGSSGSTLAILTSGDNVLTLVSWPDRTLKKFPIGQTNEPYDIVGQFAFSPQSTSTFTVSDIGNDRTFFYAYTNCSRK